jgi:hypothetical protein
LSFQLAATRELFFCSRLFQQLTSGAEAKKLMAYDKAKLLKQDNKQLGRKAIRLVQLNLRFCILFALFLITVVLVAHLNGSLSSQPKHLSLHQYVRNFLTDPYRKPLKGSDDDQPYDDYDMDDSDRLWSNETVELFQDRLGIVLDDGNKSLSCNPGKEFIVSALPDVDDLNLADNVWQYISLIALEAQTAEFDGTRRLTLRAFVTEQMRVVLDQMFDW